MANLTVSIVLYNNPSDMVQRVIASVLATSLDIRFYLIDHSPTNALNIFATQDTRIQYIHNPNNPGYGSGHNIAIKQSLSFGSKYHLVLNPDIFFEVGTLETILAYMDSHHEVGLLMPKILYPNGTIQYVARLLPTPWDLFARRFIPIKSYLKKINDQYSLTFFDYTSTIEIPFVSGCFMFLRIDALKQVGIFDEHYFMYLEDADLSRRIGTISKTILYPHVHISHEYERGAHKNFRLLWVFVCSTFTYFNKYGWFFDSFRKRINQETLQQFKWTKS